MTVRANFQLSAEQRQDARAALRRIGDRNLSLEDCVKFALALHSRADAVRTPVDQAAEAFLRVTLRRGRREATYRFYEERLAWFIRVSSGLALDDWDRPKLKAALEGMGRSPTTVRMTFRAVRALYGFAIQQDPPLAAANPATDLALDLPTRVRKIRFLSVDQVTTLVSGIQPKMLPAVVLQLFAGVRPEEIAPRTGVKPRLQWKHIDPEARIIRIEADIAKTGAERVIQNLPDTVWEWLKGLPRGEGDVCPHTPKWLVNQMRVHVGGTWIQDGLRHTFATYMMAHTSNASQVAEWLGHEGELSTFHNHYRGLAPKADGDAYVALRRVSPIKLPDRRH